MLACYVFPPRLRTYDSRLSSLPGGLVGAKSLGKLFRDDHHTELIMKNRIYYIIICDNNKDVRRVGSTMDILKNVQICQSLEPHDVVLISLYF